ncbi:MAG: membrane protein [Saprospiraceae bacterium]|nr:MAG: membrane protein [Saprospiraceae bacterium]
MIRLFIFSFICFSQSVYSQGDTLVVSLQQTIEMAQLGGPEVKIAQTSFSNSYWFHQSFLANYRPQMVLSGTLPNLDRSIQAITLPDGTLKFVGQSFMRNDISLNLNQGIPLTGGRLFAGTGLSRLDVFASDNAPAFASYRSTLISVGFIQPLFGFNNLKWAKKVQPLRYEESRRNYSENLEQVAYEAANLFFDVLVAQINLEAAQRDKANSDTLFVISKGRFDVGRIAEVELLQIELRVMDAEADLAQSMLNLQTSTERLRDFLGIQGVVNFKMIPPSEIPEFMVDAEKALDFARRYRSESVGYDRRLEEAKSDVAEAQANRGLNVDLSFSFGLSQSGETLNQALSDPLDQEQFQLSLNVPIADWGKSKADMQIALSTEELIRLQVDQDRINFEREIIIRVQQFDLVRQQVNRALKSYEIAQKRLDITRKRYRIGNILVTDLNQAIQEEANSRRSYMNALRSYWLAYYDLRRLTLYDFENNQALVRKAEDVVRGR